MLKNLYKNHAILFSICAFALTIVLLVVLSHVNGMLFSEYDMFVGLAAVEFVYALVGILLCLYFGHGNLFEFRLKGFMRGLVAGMYILVTVTLAMVLMIISGLNEGYVIFSTDHVIAFCLYMLFVGIAEETFFRGLIAERLIRHFGTTRAGIVKAAGLSGFLFGMCHMINGFQTGFLAALIQSVSVIFLGMVIALCFYKGRSLLAVIFLHAYNDFAALTAQGGIMGPADNSLSLKESMTYGPEHLIGAVPYIIVVLILLRKRNIQIIGENYAADIDGQEDSRPQPEL